MSYNRAYHRHFEGYVEKEVFDAGTGKRHIKRTYVGAYYHHKLEDEAWKKLKRKYVLLYIWSAVCLVLQGICGSSGAWYLAVPLAFGLIAFAWLGYYVVCYAMNPRKLTIRQYRDREMVKVGAMAGVLVFGWLFVGQAVWLILHRSLVIYGALCLVTDLSAIACLYLLFRTERDMDYEREKNETKPEPQSYDIRYHEEE